MAAARLFKPNLSIRQTEQLCRFGYMAFSTAFAMGQTFFQEHNKQTNDTNRTRPAKMEPTKRFRR